MTVLIPERALDEDVRACQDAIVVHWISDDDERRHERCFELVRLEAEVFLPLAKLIEELLTFLGESSGVTDYG